jgi:hypothetical protein
VLLQRNHISRDAVDGPVCLQRTLNRTDSISLATFYTTKICKRSFDWVAVRTRMVGEVAQIFVLEDAASADGNKSDDNLHLE